MTSPEKIASSPTAAQVGFPPDRLRTAIYVVFAVQLIAFVAHIVRFYATDYPSQDYAIGIWPSALIFLVIGPVAAWALRTLVITGKAQRVCAAAWLIAIVTSTVSAGGGSTAGPAFDWSTSDPQIDQWVIFTAWTLLVLAWIRHRRRLSRSSV